MRKAIYIRGGVILWILLAGVLLVFVPQVLVLAQQEAEVPVADPDFVEPATDESLDAEATENTGTLTVEAAAAAAQPDGPADPASQAQGPGNRPPAPTALDDSGLFYYGWKGERVPLILSTDRIAVTFRERVTGARAEEILGSDARFEVLSIEEYDRKQDLDLGKTVVVSTVPGLSRRNVADAIPGVAARTEVERTHPVFRTGLTDNRVDAEIEARRRGGESLDPAAVRNDDTRGDKESVLTDYLSVVVDRATPQADIEAMFAEDNLEIVSRSDYPAIGKVGYRLLVTPATLGAAHANNRAFENALTIANRYYESGRVLEATPAFAPYYDTATSVPEPGDGPYQWTDPPSPYPDPDWIYEDNPATTPQFEGVNALAGWQAAYSKATDTSWAAVMADTTYDDIVIATLDNGVWADFETPWLHFFGQTNPPYTAYLTDDDPLAAPSPKTGHPDFWKNLNNGDTVLNARKLVNPGEYNKLVGIDDDANGYIDDYFGIDFVGNDPTNGAFAFDPIPFSDDYPNDIFNLDNQHGTMFSGAVAARPNNEYAIGVCPTCQVMPVRFRLTTYEQGEVYGNADIFFIGRAEKAINYATKTGAHVAAVMMPIETYDPLIYAAVQNARANGIVVTAPAGNDDESLDARPLFPASWPEVIAVGASGSGKPEEPNGPTAEPGRGYFGYKSDLAVVGFCDPAAGYLRPNYGWALDIMAPSSKVETAINCASGTGKKLENDAYWGSDFDSAGNPITRPGSGTSIAMPQIAGLAGLILTANPLLSPAEVQYAMQGIRTVTDMEYIDGPEVAGDGRDRYTGHGRYNMGLAITEAKRDRTYFAFPDTRRPDAKLGEDSPIDSDAIVDNNENFRSIMSVDNVGDLVIDGRIVTNASATQLADNPGVTELIQYIFIGSKARLDQRYALTAGDPGSSTAPTLYLKGNVFPGQPMSYPPILAYKIYVAGVLRAYIDTSGNLYCEGQVFESAKCDSDSSTGGNVIAVDPSTINAKIADPLTTGGEVLIAAPGTYGPINFAGKSIVIRSTDPYDPHVVAQTVIMAGTNQRAVTFTGTETPEAALIGFTITGNGTAASGGIHGGAAAGTKARILYNVFINNKRSGTDANGGAIYNCDGLIEGNTFGRMTTERNEASNGGALAFCDGVIIKNFFRYNTATTQGGAIYGGAPHIVQNLIAYNSAPNGGGIGDVGGISAPAGEIAANYIFSNTATTGAGGGIYDCNFTSITQNTVYQNSAASTGGGISDSTATIHNCIVWGNLPSANQIAASTSPTYSCVQGIAVPNANNNIATDPLFVSSAYVDSVYVYDDLADNNYTGWTVWGGTWSAANGYLSGSGASGAVIQRANVNPNLDLSFRVRREAGANAALVHIRYNSAAPGDSVRLRMLQTKSVLDLRLNGVWIEALTNTDADVLLGNWYDVFVRANGDAVQVWLGRLDAGVGMTKIFDYWPDLAAVPPRPVPALTTSNLVLQADVGTTVWFDNIELDANSNLDKFLKLSGSTGNLSPCIDKGEPDLPTYRDFDDELGPLDGPDNDQPPVIRSDIGVDEYTTLSPMPYWWKNF